MAQLINILCNDIFASVYWLVILQSMTNGLAEKLWFKRKFFLLMFQLIHVFFSFLVKLLLSLLKFLLFTTCLR